MHLATGYMMETGLIGFPTVNRMVVRDGIGMLVQHSIVFKIVIDSERTIE